MAKRKSGPGDLRVVAVFSGFWLVFCGRRSTWSTLWFFVWPAQHFQQLRIISRGRRSTWSALWSKSGTRLRKTCNRNVLCAFEKVTINYSLCARRTLWLSVCENLETQVTYAKTLGSAARAKNPTTQTKKKPSTQTRSPSLKFQLLLQRTEGNKDLKLCFLSCCFDSPLNQAWLLLSLLEMKNAQLHTHLLLKNVLWHSKLFQTVPKVKLLSRQTHRKLICTNWLFVFDLFQKNSRSNMLACRTKSKRIWHPQTAETSKFVSLVLPENVTKTSQTHLKLHNLHCKVLKASKGDDIGHQNFFLAKHKVQTPVQTSFQLGSPCKRCET